jgi:RNA polymerase sigma-70 factor (ECF subfamily)
MANPVDDVVARRLLERIAQQEERALTELHRLMGRRIYAFALHRLRNEEQAESVVVDTLWEVWRSARNFRGDSQASTWIFGIARFKSFDQLRRQGPDHEDIDDFAEILPSDVDDGERALDRWQQAQRVRDCLERLSAAHRECLQLVHYEGMGLAEVASVQGVPENTVKTRMFHARKNMRVCLDDCAVGAG